MTLVMATIFVAINLVLVFKLFSLWKTIEDVNKKKKIWNKKELDKKKKIFYLSHGILYLVLTTIGILFLFLDFNSSWLYFWIVALGLNIYWIMLESHHKKLNGLV